MKDLCRSVFERKKCCLHQRNAFRNYKMQVVLPGDAIRVEQPITTLRIGPGVQEINATFSASQAGALGHLKRKKKHDESVWVESTSKRVRFEREASICKFIVDSTFLLWTNLSLESSLQDTQKAIGSI